MTDEYVLPKDVVSPGDDVFMEIVDYLEDIGAVPEDHVVRSADIHVHAEQQITVSNVTTAYQYSTYYNDE